MANNIINGRFVTHSKAMKGYSCTKHISKAVIKKRTVKNLKTRDLMEQIYQNQRYVPEREKAMPLIGFVLDYIRDLLR